MTDKTEPAKALPSKKVVPESDLMAVKAILKKVQEELSKTKEELTQTKSELKVAKMTEVDDEDVKKVRDFLLNTETELNKKQTELDKREESLKETEASVKEREKEARVQALASEYEVEVDAIKEAEDPEKEALKLKLGRLAKGKEESPAENTFETQSGGVVKKNIENIDVTTPEGRKEFEKVEAELKKAARK